MSTMLQKSLQIVVLFWTLSAHLVSAVSYKYVITYGAGAYICHATVGIYINSSNPVTKAEITLQGAYCVTSNGASGETYDIPLNVESGIVAYINNLGPSSTRGDRGFEIGFNQAKQDLAGVTIIRMDPRVSFYTDPEGEPLGACSYRQGAVAFAQADGSALEPYSRCPVGSALIGSVGRWLICNIGCNRF
ncbi:hypothetical protein CFE70_001068 [Pyrenophora teres f. teres 0-1]|uniref:Uncharacterized protein n=2 Tax=Pyrenophora teres f. teres TaxID=97479 RepID=E3RLJ9_PYRTT|nr:hypothetical protein PTT_09252 [Pyrenophora teres f. teres 0-1]